VVTGPADAEAAAHVFVDALDDRCPVEGDDGHHLQRVRRLAPRERITAADGAGAWRLYEIAESGGGRLTLAAISDRHHEVAASTAIALALAPPKRGFEEVVTQVTELGAARITPVITARTVVRWDGDRAARAVAKLRAVAREAAMQCRRATLPVVDGPLPLADIVTRADVVVADRSGSAAHSLAPPRRGEWTVVVGPEGGLAPSELDLLSGVARLSLGRYVLRAATAPVAAVAMLSDRIAHW
jgi:16S rRNA (uracil1498-N3)-methyltransferase